MVVLAAAATFLRRWRARVSFREGTNFARNSMKDNSIRITLLATRFACACVVALAAYSRAGAINIETVLIGDAGNAADSRAMSDGTSGYGNVAYQYRIGKYEITNNEYVGFLRNRYPQATRTRSMSCSWAMPTTEASCAQAGRPTSLTRSKPTLALVLIGIALSSQRRSQRNRNLSALRVIRGLNIEVPQRGSYRMRPLHFGVVICNV